MVRKAFRVRQDFGRRSAGTVRERADAAPPRARGFRLRGLGAEAGLAAGGSARDAARAAKDASKSKLDELGYNRETAKEKIQSLRSDVKEVAGAAAQRARSTAKQ